MVGHATVRQLRKVPATMTEREYLLTSIASTIKDYRHGEIDAPTANHVGEWIDQFDSDVRIPMLHELDHVFKQTYVSQLAMRKFLTKVADRLPCEFWQSVNILNIQKSGKSQSEITKLFSEILKEKYGNDIEFGRAMDGNLIYFDDAVFTGDRVISDIANIIHEIPKKIQIYIITIAIHSSAKHRIKKGFTDVHVWSGWEFENRLTWHDTRTGKLAPTDVLRPSEIGKRDPSERTSRFFSTVEGRELLEREFKSAGKRIRGFAVHPDPNLKPLGYSRYRKPKSGFGSLFVTYRNCPNNCPLALWYGDPSFRATHPGHPFSQWYPLFPRRTYRE